MKFIDYATTVVVDKNTIRDVITIKVQLESSTNLFPMGHDGKSILVDVLYGRASAGVVKTHPDNGFGQITLFHEGGHQEISAYCFQYQATSEPIKNVVAKVLVHKRPTTTCEQKAKTIAIPLINSTEPLPCIDVLLKLAGALSS